MENEFMLSTFDNPFNPFNDFTSWHLFDMEKGYNTCERLARIAHYSDEMTQKEIDEETNRAIDEIILNDPLNIYVKVYKNTPEN